VVLAALAAACSDSGGETPSDGESVGEPGAGGSQSTGGGTSIGGSQATGGGTSTGGASATGGTSSTGGTGGMGKAGSAGSANGGSAGKSGAGGAGGSAIVTPPNPCIAAGNCAPGVWTNVTPSAIDLNAMLGCGNYGTLSVVVDALHPAEVYAQFNCYGIWKSVDYGLTWNGPINTGSNGKTVSDCAGGITAANTATPTLFQSCIRGSGLGFWASTNGGVDWTKYNVAPGKDRQDFYPPTVDPYDNNHLLMCGHEMNVLVESTDGGHTWTSVNIDPKMDAPGGSAALVFVNTGSADTTRSTWIYSPQATGGTIGTWRTSDGGKTWTQVDHNEKEHSYWQIYQPDTAGVVYMAGVYSALGWGALRSPDYGKTWVHVGTAGNENIVFGTPKHIYTMDGCCGGVHLQIGDPPGTGAWKASATPTAMATTWGAGSAVVTNDGTYSIIFTANWVAGLWRYVEPTN